MGFKTRIISVLLFDEYGCVKGKRFDSSRRIGSIADRMRVVERRDIDELVLLDVSATPNNRAPRFEEVTALCDNLFCPVTVGGGIRSVADARRILAGGADKISVNSAAVERPEIINELSEKFGSQSVVVSMDVRGDCIFSRCGTQATNRDVVEWGIECEQRGCGEILLTSIDRDGGMEGYDINLVRAVSSAVSIPVIAAGGCGSYAHIAEVLYSTKAHAVAVGAAFQFCEMTPKGASRYLHDQGFQVRL